MVNIGFVCEGKSECALIKSKNFRELLNKIGLHLVYKPIDANGGGNLLPHNIVSFTAKLLNKGAQKIFILADLETVPCIEMAKRRIQPDQKIHILVIERQKIEAWFLSDNKRLMKIANKTFQGNAEKLNKPDDELKKILINTGKFRSLGHADLADIYIGNNIDNEGFDIQNSNCDSARYFISKLKEVAKKPKKQNKIKNKIKKNESNRSS